MNKDDKEIQSELQAYRINKLLNEVGVKDFDFNGRVTFNGNSLGKCKCKYLLLSKHPVLCEDDLDTLSTKIKMRISYPEYKYVKYLTHNLIAAQTKSGKIDVLFLDGKIFRQSVESIDYGDDYIRIDGRGYIFNTYSKMWFSIVPPKIDRQFYSIDKIKSLRTNNKSQRLDIYECLCTFFDIETICYDPDGNDPEDELINCYTNRGVVSNSGRWIIAPDSKYLGFKVYGRLILAKTSENVHIAFFVDASENLCEICKYDFAKSYPYFILFQYNGLQAIYDLTLYKFTGYIFDKSKRLMPEFYGEGLIGVEFFEQEIGTKKRNVKKNGFIDYRGKLGLVLEKFWRISKGFEKGEAIIYRDFFGGRRLYRTITIGGEILKEDEVYTESEPYYDCDDMDKDNFYGLTDGMLGDYPFD